MTCTKTDFRTYQPLTGQPEEICWTCGVVKDAHKSEQTNDNLFGVTRSGYTSTTELSAWIPDPSTPSPTKINLFEVGTVIRDKKHRTPHTWTISAVDHAKREYHYFCNQDPKQKNMVSDFDFVHRVTEENF